MNGPQQVRITQFIRDGSIIHLGDALSFYEQWDSPIAIISDGPYGLGSYPGDPETVEGLPAVYRPHLVAWAKYALPSTTLWFWNSELGWATIHPLLTEYGWEFRNCHIWDKGIAHVAGNSNTKTLRKFPVVTEVCVQYVRRVSFAVNGAHLSMQDWLRHEWARTGLPFSKTNEACGVKNAATRKYFTKCHLWYFPPPEAFEAFAAYANKHGRPSGRPYFSADGKKTISAAEWAKMRAKFYCHNGTTNVWRENAVRGIERLKDQNGYVHMNQKPLKLLELCIEASTDEGDVVWEPFGGLCSASIAAHKTKRRSYAAEVIPEFFDIACKRLDNYDVF
jgi:FAD/FMN-containing dehydrogenase